MTTIATEASAYWHALRAICAMFTSTLGVLLFAIEEVAAVNLAALIGEVTSTVEPPEGEVARFSLAVIGRFGAPPDVFRVQTGGAQAVQCRRFLRPGHRIAIEGRVVPGADPIEILAERVQFLTTRAQAEAMRREITVQ